jgi:hypothetical protein
MSADRQHHPYSPSTLQCREACPKYQPTHSDNEASVMGTLQHSAVESELDDDRIPDYRALAVAQCKQFAEQRIAAYPGGTVLREEYLPVDDEVIRVKAPDLFDPDHFLGTTAGYLDLGIVSADETHAEIIDWKYGDRMVTDAEDNLQGISYMLGLKKRFPKLQTCLVRFIQPHIDYETSHTFDISNPAPYLLRVRAVVLRAIEAANNQEDFSNARPTVGTCLFCSLVGRCPKVAELAIKVGKKYAPLAVPDDINTVTLADPAQVSAGMKLAQVVSIWAESYRKNATQKAVNSEDFIPEGYALVSSQRASVKDARKVGEIAKEFLPPEDHKRIEALYEISLTPIDKLLSLRSPRGSKEATVKLFREKIISEGAAELGQPFAFLKLEDKK